MELVDIEDVYPYQDGDVRMNPRDVETPECQAYIDELAEQFRHNRLNPGQPRMRPILYRDGGIYQIIDGECRYWAMRRLGTRKFYADVFDDLADAETSRQEAAKAMVETDCKRPLTAEELSRGVQTMLELDVPDEEVAASARVGADKVRRARRGRRDVGDDAYYMTLDQLAAIGEFDGDEEAVAQLTGCRPSEFRGVYERLVRERDRKRVSDGIAAACRAAGLAGVEQGDEGYALVTTIYLDEKAPEKAREAIEEGGLSGFRLEPVWLNLYRAETEEDRAQGEEARRERDERTRAFEQAREGWRIEREAQEAWLAGNLGDLRSMRATAALLADRAMEEASDLISRTGADADFSPTPALVLVGWCRSWAPDDRAGARFATNARVEWLGYGSDPDGYVELMDAMEKDGYRQSDTGGAVTAALRELRK